MVSGLNVEPGNVSKDRGGGQSLISLHRTSNVLRLRRIDPNIRSRLRKKGDELVLSLHLLILAERVYHLTNIKQL